MNATTVTPGRKAESGAPAIPTESTPATPLDPSVQALVDESQVALESGAEYLKHQHQLEQARRLADGD